MIPPRAMRRYKFLRAWIRTLELFGVGLMLLGGLVIAYGFFVGSLVERKLTGTQLALLLSVGIALIGAGAGELLLGQGARVVLDIRDFAVRQTRLLRQVRNRLPAPEPGPNAKRLARRPLPPVP